MRLYRNITLLAASIIMAATATAQNKVSITATDGTVKSYNTADVERIRIDGSTLTVLPQNDNIAAVRMNFMKIATGSVEIREANGWLESAYVTWEPLTGATSYHVYIKGGTYSDYTRLDDQLVRNYGTYGRADAVGLQAGTYSMKVVPVINNVEDDTKASEASSLIVTNYDRHGFAHFNRTEGVGAYNNDGTLKQGARVVYVTKDNAKTVSLSIVSGKKGKETVYTGIQQIIYGYQKGLDARPLDVRIVGKLSKDDCDELLSSSEGMQIKGASAYMPVNITIEGIGNDATVWGFGFLIRSVSSVEMRNIGVMWFMDDGISIDTKNSNIWVHNCDIFYGQKGSDSDQAKGDGSFDLKGDSRYITCSYNRFWDSGKCSLCGMKSETWPNYITYHHNWFDHADSRMPRIRTMTVHVYNNYYDQIAKYGVGAANQGNAFVECNYFNKAEKPMLISMQGSDIKDNPKGTFSGEDGGMIKAWNNVMVRPQSGFSYITYQQDNTQFDAYEVENRSDRVPSDVKAVKGGRTYDNFDTDASLMYDVTPDDPNQIPSIVTGFLGAGRMNHGDFSWHFDDNTGSDSHDAAVDTDYQKALQSYQSSLVGFYE